MGANSQSGKLASMQDIQQLQINLQPRDSTMVNLKEIYLYLYFNTLSFYIIFQIIAACIIGIEKKNLRNKNITSFRSRANNKRERKVRER